MSADPFGEYEKRASELIRSAAASISGREPEVVFSVPGRYADFEFPCFQMAKELHMSPQKLAESLAQQVKGEGLEASAVNGYVNINADRHRLAIEVVNAVLQHGESYGRTVTGGGTILVEHTSVNPNGPLHIGRTRNAIIGDTLVRCLRKAGHHVRSEYYVNDVGRQVVTLLWGMLNLMKSPPEGKPDHAMVRYYIQARELMEKDPAVDGEIKEMQRKIEAGDLELLRKIRELAKKVLSGIRESLSNIGIDYDGFAFESDLITNGAVRKTIELLKELPSAQNEGGAWFIPFGKEKFYFTRSDGTSLYTARDIAYHLDKLRRAERLINVLGEDQKLGASFLIGTLSLLGVKAPIDFLFHSFVSLEEGKMATREGRVVLLDAVIKEAVEKARGEVLKRRADIGEEEVGTIAAAVGKGAVRYNIVRLQAEKKLIFRWSEALDFEGDSAPFVQYAHARACSILRKAGEWSRYPSSYLEEEELRLARQLALFPRLLKDISASMAVHRLPLYAHQLASDFNQFYRVVPVLRADGETRDSRLCLVECTRIVLHGALECMGIEAPERM